MDSTDFINTLKLRASIGRSYNSLIGNRPYEGYWRGGVDYIQPSAPGTAPL